MKFVYGITLLLLSVLIVAPVNGQYHSESKKAVRIFKEALEHYQNREPETALDELRKVVRADDNFIEAWMLMAQIYKEQGNTDAAVSAFEKAMIIDPEYHPEGYMILARVEYGRGKYDKALAHVEQFLKLGDFSKVTNEDARTLKKRCLFAISAVKNPVLFDPENLGDSVNSPKNEYWPSLSVDESTLIFTVLDPKNPDQPVEYGNMQEDFYASVKKADGTWSRRHNLGKPLNSSDNEGAQSLSADGSTLYFTACNRPDGMGLCDIYRSRKENNSWSTPENLGPPLNSGYSDKQPSVSADGKTLFFASDRPGGKGGLDIWYSRMSEEGKWQDPVNAGDSINTPMDEQSPFIHPDGQTLYFSSEGHLSMNLGKGDIFISRLTGQGTWGAPENLGYPINTSDNEIGLIVNSEGNKAFFSSDRLEGRGMDIYEFELYPEARPLPVSYMKGRVYDAGTYRGLRARFQLIDLATGNIRIESYAHEGEGDFLVPLPTGHDFALNVSHPGYLFYSENFSLEGKYEKTDPYLKDIPLKPVKPGETIVLKNVFYKFDSAELLDESVAELKKVVDFLRDNPGVHAEISGHTDSVGSDAYNQQLSERRAKSVVNYLEKQGISSDRLTSEGYGASRPVATNQTEEGRALNRRTELKILEP